MYGPCRSLWLCCQNPYLEGGIEQILWENRLKIGALDWASNLCVDVLKLFQTCTLPFLLLRVGVREEVVAAGHTGTLNKYFSLCT